MSKIIKISGCKDCPYVVRDTMAWCRKFEFEFWDDDNFKNNIPETPHPNCKLPDLPTNSEIIDFKTGDPNPNFNDGFISGANYVIEKISGSNS